MTRPVRARLSLPIIGGLILAACATTPAAAPPTERPAPRADLAIAQIPGDARPVAPAQIAPKESPATLVEQLETYADSCAPGAVPTPGVDCSELRLRIERAARDDDELARALALLGTLDAPPPSDDDDARRRADAARDGGGLDPALLLPSDPVPEPEPDPVLEPQSDPASMPTLIDVLPALGVPPSG